MHLPLLFMEEMGPWSIILIVVVVLLLFGGKKIPELMRGMGKGIGEFKKGISENGDSVKKEEDKKSK